MEVANETKASRNSQYPLADATNDRRTSGIDNKSTRYNRGSKGISELSQEQQGEINNRTTNKEIVRNNRQELDNSSFSLKKDIIKELL